MKKDEKGWKRMKKDEKGWKGKFSNKNVVFVGTQVFLYPFKNYVFVSFPQTKILFLLGKP